MIVSLCTDINTGRKLWLYLQKAILSYFFNFWAFAPVTSLKNFCDKRWKQPLKKCKMSVLQSRWSPSIRQQLLVAVMLSLSVLSAQTTLTPLTLSWPLESSWRHDFHTFNFCAALLRKYTWSYKHISPASSQGHFEHIGYFGGRPAS